MSQIFAETTAYPNEFLNITDTFYVNNTFYLLAPPYYRQFFTNYLRPALMVYDSNFYGYYNYKQGFAPQKALQCVTTGLNNMLFAFGVDFRGEDDDYRFAVKWAKKAKFYKALKLAHKYAIAGGTALMKLNRDGSDLYMSAHRIDNFYADIDAMGNVSSVKVYYDALTNTNPSSKDQAETHYCLCEERYFNEDNIPCVKTTCYVSAGTMQTEVVARPTDPQQAEWEKIPRPIKRLIKKNYPSVLIGKEQYLPFKDNLGCYLMKATDGIPEKPTLPFGQPIGNLLADESFQYDQLKYFEKNEVDLARARALIPEEMWNKDDPNYDQDALSERFYQQVESVNDQVVPIQFNLRAGDIKIQRENILKDMAFKLNVSASSIASFLDDGQGAMTATQIISERTKSDTWVKSQINIISPDINEMLEVVMRYYGKLPVEIVLKAENQSPFLERLKTYSDVFSAGNMSEEAFVRAVHRDMSESEQQREIAYLEAEKELRNNAQFNAPNGVENLM